MNINDLMQMSVEDLCEYCDNTFFNFPVMNSINTPDELSDAAKYMGEIIGYNSFILSMLSHLRYLVREAKRNGDKILAEDLIDKRDILDNALKAIKDNYAYLSRCVSIHRDIMDELSMTDSISESKQRKQGGV